MRAQFVINLLRNKLGIILPVESPISHVANHFQIARTLLQVAKPLELTDFHTRFISQSVDVHQLLVW